MNDSKSIFSVTCIIRVMFSKTCTMNIVFKLNDNDASIVCETLEIASTLEDAVNNLEKQLIDRKNSNRERDVEHAMAENELKKQIKKTGAGSL